METLVEQEFHESGGLKLLTSSEVELMETVFSRNIHKSDNRF